MFTGLIQAVGTVRAVEAASQTTRLLIDASSWTHRPALGQSIAVNGCCLTLAGESGPANLLAFDAVPETLSRTTLGALAPGARVNLEHSVTAATLLGGHVVQGHIDGVGIIEAIKRADEYRLTVRPPPPLMEFIIPKGSICLDGVSLTLAAVDGAAGLFEVALIPATLDATTLTDLAEGARCNLETDILSRTLVHWLRNYGPR